jgi:hypothetical protein
MIELFQDKLSKDEPFVFTKFGDGEIICMLNFYKNGDTNCDYQSYSNQLKLKTWVLAFLLLTFRINGFLGIFLSIPHSKIYQICPNYCFKTIL